MDQKLYQLMWNNIVIQLATGANITIYGPDMAIVEYALDADSVSMLYDMEESGVIKLSGSPTSLEGQKVTLITNEVSQ